MARLVGAQRLVLQAILDLPTDAAGSVLDAQIAQHTQITITDVRDWIQTLVDKDYVEVARTMAGLNASTTALGRQVLRQFDPVSPADGPAAMLPLGAKGLDKGEDQNSEGKPLSVPSQPQSMKRGRQNRQGQRTTSGLFKWCDEQALFSGDKLRNQFSSPALAKIVAMAACPWCCSPLEKERFSRDFPSFQLGGALIQCPKCGWHHEHALEYSFIAHIHYSLQIKRGILREFDINDVSLSTEEIGTHLKHNFSDLYNLDWRRFEELVEDVFKNQGYRTRFAQATRDDGTDIILLDKDGNKQAIVQVEKYADSKTVGVALVRQLIGAQVHHDVQTGYLVTTTEISDDALEFVETVNRKKRGLAVVLWDALRLMRELGVYDDSLLPISSIKGDRPLYQQLPMYYHAPQRIIIDVKNIKQWKSGQSISSLSSGRRKKTP